MTLCNVLTLVRHGKRDVTNIFSPGWVFTFVLEFHYYDRMSQKWGILFCVVRGLEIATPSARNDREGRRNDKEKTLQ